MQFFCLLASNHISSIIDLMQPDKMCAAFNFRMFAGFYQQLVGVTAPGLHVKSNGGKMTTFALQFHWRLMTHTCVIECRENSAALLTGKSITELLMISCNSDSPSWQKIQLILNRNFQAIPHEKLSMASAKRLVAALYVSRAARLILPFLWLP